MKNKEYLHAGMLPRAVRIAGWAHDGQLRRDGVTPYIKHVAAVANAVARKGYGDEEITVAWLHDVVEQANIEQSHLDQLLSRFPDEVVAAVLALTHRKNETYADYIKRVKDNRTATVVKLEDIADNLADTPTPRQVAKYQKALDVLTK